MKQKREKCKMKKKILSSIICVVILFSMSIVANAAWTSVTRIQYKSDYNYPGFSGAPWTRKNDSNCLNNAISATNRTSWTVPKAGICDTTNTPMTTLNSVLSDPIILMSYAEAGKLYSVIIYGSPSQSGTDYIDVKYNLDYS